MNILIKRLSKHMNGNFLIAGIGLRKQMGNFGRIFVEKKYNWKNNIDQMINLYYQTIELHKNKSNKK